MGLIIRNGDDRDIPAMVALDALCFPEGIRYDAETFAFWFSNPYATAFVAEEEKDHRPFMAGFVIGTYDRGRAAVAQLITLDVHPDFRRQGIGHELLQRIESAMKKKGLEKMILEVYTQNLDALSLYQAQGYRIFASIPDYYGQDQDGYLMLKEL